MYKLKIESRLIDYNVGRSGSILTLPMYMAFLLSEV